MQFREESALGTESSNSSDASKRFSELRKDRRASIRLETAEISRALDVGEGEANIDVDDEDSGRDEMRRHEDDDSDVDDEGEEMTETHSDLIGERSIDDLEVGAEAIEDATGRRGIKVAERRMSDSSERRDEQCPSRLEAPVVADKNPSDRDEQIDETCGGEKCQL